MMPRITLPTPWLVVGAAAVVCAMVVAYVAGTSSQTGPSAQIGSPSSATSAASPQPRLVDEQQIRTYREILNRDPTNVRAAVQLGNLLYDAGRYEDAIAPYRQAFTLNPRDVNLSTDLGTALHYSGRHDEALAQYEKSLAIDPSHAQTLFNMGIVKRDGKQDFAGAIGAWERLIATNPTYPDRSVVEQAIANARQSAGGIERGR